ncbi:MAG: S9 family peptidase [Armatimonadetes bacterium]|nr:S9 family peptidase [Armatimonadota bacterium]
MTPKQQVYKESYPPARKGESADSYHGAIVSDPYRWLEDPDSPETQDWVEAQNRLTADFLATPAREEAKARLTALWDYPKHSAPWKEGNRYFFWKNDGLQNQAILYRQDTLKSEPMVVIDPNTLSEDGTVAVTNAEISKDGSLMAYGLSESGSDRQEIRIRSIDTGEDLSEVIRWCKFASIAWKRDGSGFFYNRFPEPGTVPEEDLNNYSRVYWHALNTAQEDDSLIYERPDQKEWGFSPSITEDGKYLLLYVFYGTESKNRLYYREVESRGPFVKLLDEADAYYHFIDNTGPVFYMATDWNAPKGRIIAIDIENPGRENWQEIAPEQVDSLQFAAPVGGRLAAAYLKDATHRLRLYGYDGGDMKEVPLPTLGSLAGLSGKRDESEMFLGFTSFLYPTTIFRYDLETGERSEFRSSGVDFNPAGYETKQVFYPSKDGTRVPMFIIHKKGLALDGSAPAILYGYGGFDISLTPSFSVSRLIWLEKGGVYAVANLRGGSEYGQEWHRAGMLGKKQNVFDDFIAAAEWLIANRYTSSSRLAIQGGSNGGLLVAACITQRPDFFGAVLCQVPVTDMLRFHKFTVGHYWVPEYGNAEADPEHFRFLLAYSPLHNIAPGAAYPPTLITTADTDDRVVPAHAKKFAAALQAADAGNNPILIRIETKAGHGGGKPTAKVIEEQADLYAFLFRAFGME